MLCVEHSKRPSKHLKIPSVPAFANVRMQKRVQILEKAPFFKKKTGKSLLVSKKAVTLHSNSKQCCCKMKILSKFEEIHGQIPEWPNGADCKSAGVRLRWFESIFAHNSHAENRGSSSVDRALAFQAGGRGFEPRLPLKLMNIKVLLL